MASLFRSFIAGLSERERRLVMVTGDGTLNSGCDDDKAALFESWGYEVAVISDDDDLATFDAAAASNEVMYISELAGAPLKDNASSGVKARNLDIGIVSEEATTWQPLMFDTSMNLTGTSIETVTVTSHAHFITNGFTVGDVTVFIGSAQVSLFKGDLPPGMEILAEVEHDEEIKQAIMVLDAGAEADGGYLVPDRRVFLYPDANNCSAWHPNTQTFVRRAVEWAAGR